MRLTEELLYKLGFRGEGKDIINKPTYRLKMPNYSYGELQVCLGDYPDTNPNSGIVSLYERELKDMHCLTDAPENEENKYPDIDVIQWCIDGRVGGIKYVTFKERSKPIASSITTLDQLNAIYCALCGAEPLKPRS